MVAITQIIQEDLTTELGLRVNQDVTARNGVKYRWAGAAWVVVDNNGVSGVRNGSIANREMAQGLTNLGRQRNGLQPIAFDPATGKPQAPITATPNNAAGQPDPNDAVVNPARRRADIASMDPDELMTRKEMNLSGQEKRTLRNGGMIRRNGVWFNNEDIDNMEGRLKTIRARRSDRAQVGSGEDRYQKWSKKDVFRPKGTFARVLGIVGLASIPAYEELRQLLRENRISEQKLYAEIQNNTEWDDATKDEKKNILMDEIARRELRIFAMQTAPLVLALTQAVIASSRAAMVVIRYGKLILQGGAQALSSVSPMTFLGTAAINIIVFVVTELATYFAIRWIMRTETGQAFIKWAVTSMWGESVIDYFADFARMSNDVIEGSLFRERADQYREIVGAGLEVSTAAIGNHLDADGVKAYGADEAERIRGAWDEVYPTVTPDRSQGKVVNPNQIGDF